MTEHEGLTHLDADGNARMVDVSAKEVTRRMAAAEGRIRMGAETLAALAQGSTPKGDVLATARIAGIQAGKRTGDLIPLCHVLPATSIKVELALDPDLPGLRAHAEASVRGNTGVEMEALTAVSVALLTVYDMLKGIDRGMVLEEVRLLRKEGGRTGLWTAEVAG